MPVDIKRALKDKAYLDSLSEAERKEFLQKSKELDDSELERVGGGISTDHTSCGQKPTPKG
jgi:hypothetical protein